MISFWQRSKESGTVSEVKIKATTKKEEEEEEQEEGGLNGGFSIDHQQDQA